MAYETGTAQDTGTLLDKMKTFLEANGWTTNAYVDDGAHGAKRLHVMRDGMYFNLRSMMGEDFGNASSMWPAYTSAYYYGIALYGSTGYDAGLNSFKNQPGYAFCKNWSNCNAAVIMPTPTSNAAIIAYHFFHYTTPVPSFFCIIEYASGCFQYLGFGKLNKFGNYDGGEFFMASRWSYSAWWNVGNTDGTFEGANVAPFSLNTDGNTWVRANVDSSGLAWFSNSSFYYFPNANYCSQLGFTGRVLSGSVWAEHASSGGYNKIVDNVNPGCWWNNKNEFPIPHYKYFRIPSYNVEYSKVRGPNQLNSLTILLPFYLFVERDPITTGIFSPIGYPANIFYCDMSLLANGGQYVYGGDTYLAFSIGKKGTTYVGNEGWVLKIVN